MSQDNPRIAVLSFAIECNRFSPVTTAEDFETDVDIRGNQIVSEARSGASITLPDLPGFFTEMDRTGQLDAGAAARLAGPARRSGRGELLQGISWPRSRPACKAALPLDAVFVSAHGAALAEGTDDPDGDLFELDPPRRRSRHPGRRDVRPARQRLAQDDRQPLGVRGLSREPAHRHLRARRRSRQAHARVPGRRAHRRHHGQGAAGAAADLAADRQGPLRRPDQVRPDQGRRRHPERLGDGGLRLQRQPQERPHRRGDRAQRQPAGGRRAVARHRQARLGHEGALQAADDGDGRRRPARRLGRPRPAPQADHPGRRRRQSRRRRARQHHLSAARAEGRPRPARALRRVQRRRRRRQGARAGRRRRSSPPRSTPRSTRNSPCPSTARPRSSSCPTASMSAAAAC